MGINNKKIIVCDLDGTLAESKSAISDEMVQVLCDVLRQHFLAIVSGGTYSQLQRQVLLQLSCPQELLENLLLFPTNGSTCYKYNIENKQWEQIYNEVLTTEERKKIKIALTEAATELNLPMVGDYGEIIEDRESQVTFSGCGQEAPIEVKASWDPDQQKRQNIIELLKRKIPDFEIRIGGMTSIDITRRGIDKAYAVKKIQDLTSIGSEDIVFVGDALYKGGNDASIKKTEVDYIQEDGPNETMEFLRGYL
jgi:HAD superfamily hydrolase (TIGR01484 family)